MKCAAIFEAPLTRQQALRLGELIREAKSRRPVGVLEVRLYLEGGVGRLISLWEDRSSLEAYLGEVDVPRGTELMRAVGVEPRVRVADVIWAD